MKPEAKAKMVASLKEANKNNAKPFVMRLVSFPIPEGGDAHLSHSDRRAMATVIRSATCGSLSEGADILLEWGILNRKNKPFTEFGLSGILAPQRFSKDVPECDGAMRVENGIRRWIVLTYINEEHPGHFPGNDRKPVIQIGGDKPVAHKSLLCAAGVVVRSQQLDAEITTVRGVIKRAAAVGAPAFGFLWRMADKDEAKAIADGTFGKEGA